MCLSWKHYHLQFLFRGDDCVVLCMLINAWLYYSTQRLFSFIYNCIVPAHGLDKLNDKDILFFMCQSLIEYFYFCWNPSCFFPNTCSKCYIIMGNISSARMSKINVHYIFIALFAISKKSFWRNLFIFFHPRKIKFIYVLV